MSAAAMLSSSAFFLFLSLSLTAAAPYTGYRDHKYAPNAMNRDGDMVNIQSYKQPVIRAVLPAHNYQPRSQSFHLPTQAEIQLHYQPRETKILPYHQPRQPAVQSYQPGQPQIQSYYQPRQPQIQYHQPGQPQIQSYYQPGQPQTQYNQPGQSQIQSLYQPVQYQYHQQFQPQSLIQNHKQPYSRQPYNPLPMLQSIPTAQKASQSSHSQQESQTIQDLVNELRSLATLKSKTDRKDPPTDPTVLSLPPIQVISEGNDGELLAIASLNGAGHVGGVSSSTSGNRDQVKEAAIISLIEDNRGTGGSSSGKATMQMDLDIGISSDNTQSNSNGGLHMNIPMPDTNEKKSILQYLRRSLPSSTQRNGVFDYVKSLLNNGGKVAISSITDEQTGEATAQMKIDINAKQGNTQTTYTNKNAGGLHMRIPLPDASEKQNIMHYLQKALTSMFSSSANSGTTSGSAGR